MRHEFLFGEAEVRESLDSFIHHPVHLALHDKVLCVGPFDSADGHELHILSTIGGGNWVHQGEDEFRFLPSSGILVSLWLVVPEDLNVDGDRVYAWLDVDRTSGGLKLASRKQFEPPATSTFWVAPDGHHLGGFVSDLPLPSSLATRVAVADSLDLLFEEGEYVGWLLADPEYHLSSGWEFENSEPRDARLANWLKDYFDIVREPFVEDMEDEDPEIRDRLRSLLSRIDASTGAQARRGVVLYCIKELIDWFYGNDAPEGGRT